MPCCAAFGCSTKDVNKKAEPPITLHIFPSDPDQRKKWIKAVRRKNWTPSRTSVLCSKHFRKEDIEWSPFYSKLKKGVVPSIFDAYPDHLKPKQPEERREIIKYEKDVSPEREIKREPSPVNNTLQHIKEEPQGELIEKFDNTEAALEESKAAEENYKVLAAQLQQQLDKNSKILDKTKSKLIDKNKQIKTLHQRLNRLTKRNGTLKNIIKQLQESLK